MTKTLNFTKSALTAIAAPARGRDTYKDSKSSHLRIRVSAAGNKVFYYQRRFKGELLWIKIGGFPDITVSRARGECDRLSGELSAGRDPRIPDVEKMTFENLFIRYYDGHLRPNCRAHLEDKRKYEQYLYSLRKKQASLIKRALLRSLHSDLKKKHGMPTANRAIQLVSRTFNYAIKDLEYDLSNPAYGFRYDKEEPRERFLDKEELKRFLMALEQEENGLFRDFFKLCLFTGARRRNVQAMRWDEVNLDKALWIIPANKSKNSRTMTIPLVPQAVSILRLRHASGGGEWVFPSKKRNPKCPYMVEPKKAWKRILKKAAIKDLRIHDLRRTQGSWQVMTGASLPVIGQALGHRDSKSTQIYARITDEAVRQSMTKAVSEMTSDS